jgi:hypothetical protein
MNSSNLRDSNLVVQSVGEAALEKLSSSQHAEVVTAVSQAVYLLTNQDELLWMASGTVPMHRRCLRISSPLPVLAKGTTFGILNGILETSSRYRLDFSHSPVWKTPTLQAGQAIEIRKLPELVTGFYNQFLTRQEPSGLGSLIPVILKSANRQPSTPESDLRDVILHTARPAVQGIISSLLSYDSQLLLEASAHLVGLGAGLTPSGDDFLGGLFFCLWLLNHTYPGALDIAHWTYSKFILQCKPLTNLISFTLLKDHADGHTLEPLHRLANALLEGHPVETILPIACELIRVGHSTGWDLLTGFLAGLSVTFAR